MSGKATFTRWGGYKYNGKLLCHFASEEQAQRWVDEQDDPPHLAPYAQEEGEAEADIEKTYELIWQAKHALLRASTIIGPPSGDGLFEEIYEACNALRKAADYILGDGEYWEET